MNVWGKVFFAFLAVVLLTCIGGGLAFHLGGGTEVVKDFTQGISGIQSSAQSVESLSKDFPFDPPEDGLVAEGRLLACMEVCREVKPAVDAYGGFIESHQGKQGDLKDAREAIRMTADTMREFVGALRKHCMSPREFSWIQKTMESAFREAAAKGCAPLLREILEALEEASENPSLPSGDREALRTRIEDFRTRLSEIPGGSLSPNARLYLRHSDEWEACRLNEYGAMVLSGRAGPHGGPTVRIEPSGGDPSGIPGE